MRYGKPYWDYDPCEECNAEECEKCEYNFSGKEEENENGQTNTHTGDN